MSQQKWEAASGLQFIPHDRPGMPETVDGYTWGHFALTYRRFRGLVLFHLPTGWEMPGRLAFKTRGAAMKLAQGLAPLTDWSRDRDTLAADEGLHRRVNDTIRPFLPE